MASRSAFTKLESDALSMYRFALERVNPGTLFQRRSVRMQLQELESSAEEVYLVAVGKAGLSMADAVISILSGFVAGITTIPVGYLSTWTREIPSGLIVVEGDHPVPGAKSVAATSETRKFVDNIPADASVVVLVSGGGSALWGNPAPGIAPDTYRRITQYLHTSGLPIHIINAIRREISSLANGRLAMQLVPRKAVTFVLSDVVGTSPGLVSSGPMFHLPRIDSQTLRESLPDSIGGEVCALIENTEELADPWPKGEAIVIGSSIDFLAAAAVHAVELGYRVELKPNALYGDAAAMGRVLATQLSEMPTGSCLIAGGECTVEVEGDGKGGRNQELALMSALRLAQLESEAVLLAASSDGIDGTSPASGAIVSRKTVADTHLQAMSALENNDTDGYFRRHGGQLVTGPTHTNVLDIVIALT